MDRTALLIRLSEDIGKEVRDETILRAFRAVPRHLFVSSFYNRDASNPYEWHRVSPDDPGWLEQIYTNRPLTTALDATLRNPTVSSSQPDLMAQMMESVRVQPGMRVLEIGTGTGYNAALLASIAGTENVVSVDINAALLAAARERIESSVGPGVTLLHADGRTLPPDLGPFDAIIVTAAHCRLEPSWIAALALGGRIVLNLKLGAFCGVMIEAEKTESGLVGRVCPYEGAFMSLRDEIDCASTQSRSPRLGLVTMAEFRPHLENPDFLFYLHTHLCVTMTRYRSKAGERSYALQDEHERIVLFAPFCVRGDASLWETIQVLSTQFEALGRPSRFSFAFTADRCGALLFSLS